MNFLRRQWAMLSHCTWKAKLNFYLANAYLVDFLEFGSVMYFI